MLSPYLLPSSFSARVVSASLWASSFIRSISSANARLLILVPLIFTPPSLSLILSSILSNTSMKYLAISDLLVLCLCWLQTTLPVHFLFSLLLWRFHLFPLAVVLTSCLLHMSRSLPMLCFDLHTYLHTSTNTNMHTYTRTHIHTQDVMMK